MAGAGEAGGGLDGMVVGDGSRGRLGALVGEMMGVVGGSDGVVGMLLELDEGRLGGGHRGGPRVRVSGVRGVGVNVGVLVVGPVLHVAGAHARRRRRRACHPRARGAPGSAPAERAPQIRVIQRDELAPKLGTNYGGQGSIAARRGAWRRWLGPARPSPASPRIPPRVPHYSARLPHTFFSFSFFF